MQVSELYGFVLLIVVTGILVGVGVLALDSFSTSSGVTSAAQLAINGSRAAVGTIGTTWMSLIVTIGVLAIIISLVVAGFAMRGRK